MTTSSAQLSMADSLSLYGKMSARSLVNNSLPEDVLGALSHLEIGKFFTYYLSRADPALPVPPNGVQFVSTIPTDPKIRCRVVAFGGHIIFERLS